MPTPRSVLRAVRALLTGLYRLLDDPLAASPKGRSIAWMVRPWHIAVGVYGLALPFGLLHLGDSWLQSAARALGFGYAAMAVIILIFPVAQAAMTWSGERDRDTLESLVLTPAARRRLVWLRFLGIASPWAALFVVMVPAYVILAGNIHFRTSGESLHEVFESQPVVGLTVAFAQPKEMHWSPGWLRLIVLRLVNDFSLLVFAVALAFWLSARCRTSLRALALTFTVILACCALLFPSQTHYFLVRQIYDWLAPAPPRGWPPPLGQDPHAELGMIRYRGIIATCTWLSVGLLLLRFTLAWSMVGSVARNFDRWMLRDKSAPRS